MSLPPSFLPSMCLWSVDSQTTEDLWDYLGPLHTPAGPLARGPHDWYSSNHSQHAHTPICSQQLLAVTSHSFSRPLICSSVFHWDYFKLVSAASCRNALFWQVNSFELEAKKLAKCTQRKLFLFHLFLFLLLLIFCQEPPPHATNSKNHIWADLTFGWEAAFCYFFPIIWSNWARDPKAILSQPLLTMATAA